MAMLCSSGPLRLGSVYGRSRARPRTPPALECSSFDGAQDQATPRFHPFVLPDLDVKAVAD